MPLVEAKIYATLVAAVDSPDDYDNRGNRKKLSAAFDIASSQIAYRVFGFESENRTMLRRKLNGIDPENIPAKYKSLINALKKALAKSEPLYSKEYSDEDEEAKEFIESWLEPLVTCIAEVD